MAKRFQLLQGNEAVVEGAIAAGMRFYAGYPITPSTEIAERSAVRLPQVGGKFIQMEDEIGGIAAALGASVATESNDRNIRSGILPETGEHRLCVHRGNSNRNR